MSVATAPPASTATVPRADKRPGLRAWYERNAAQVLIVASLVLLVSVFSVTSPYFLTWSNITGLLLASAVTGIMALGMTFVIATSGIDLTPGFGMALTSVITALAMVNFGLPVWVGVLAGILSGSLIGVINGFLVAVLNMQPMIATLAMMLVCQGLALVLSGASPIYLNEVPGFQAISRGTPVFGIPNAVLIFFAVAVLASLLLKKSLIGRYALAMGSNEEATRLSGIGVRKWKILVYTLAGTFTGLAGVVMAARLNSAQPAIGAGYEMYAIAAAVLGGASLRGGKANIFGTVIGALVITTIQNGLQIMAVPDQWQKIVLGVVVLGAVYLDVRRSKNAR